MEMEFICIYPGPSPITKLLVLICFFWPFVAISFLPRRGKSAAPVVAALVPLALSSVDVWLGLMSVTRGMAITGVGERATAAGIADSLARLFIGGCFAIAVIVFAAIRRHRPIVDRMTAMLAAVFIVNVIGVLIAGAMIRQVIVAVLIAGAIVAGIVAVAAIVWTFQTGRGRVTSAALPHGVAVVAILMVVIGVIVWELAHGYLTFAMGR